MFPGGQASGGEARKFLWARDTRSRLWQHIFGRVVGQSSCLPTDHDSAGDGMRQRRNDERRNLRFKWGYLSVKIGSTVLLVCIGCRHERQVTPDATYNGIEKEFISGNLPAAREKAEETHRRFESSSPDWAARVRLGLAKVLVYQSQSAEGLPRLQ